MKVKNILILGSAPNAVIAKDWSLAPFSSLIVINNAWKIRPDWTHNIFPTDFPNEKRPKPSSTQCLVSADKYVSVQNSYGGFVYAGGTMAITAAYWALATFKPNNLFFLGCDMVYGSGKTHFYGFGTADPLRKDISLRSLEAKTSRFECFAGLVGCNVYNLSKEKESRLVYRRKDFSSITTETTETPRNIDKKQFNLALRLETKLNYFVPDGKYWKHENKFKMEEIDRLDKIWLKCLVK
ncbi:MAG: hypothetical protein P8M50_04935 [Paracoccaceae bacterium]|nr:hypothetical protein [Paracoccaceae bacterium]